jgi:hypothetical protein
MMSKKYLMNRPPLDVAAFYAATADLSTLAQGDACCIRCSGYIRMFGHTLLRNVTVYTFGYRQWPLCDQACIACQWVVVNFDYPATKYCHL